MANVYITSVTLKKLRLTIGGSSFPIIGAYADFSEVDPNANDTIYFSNSIITQIRNLWGTDAFLCSVAYRGSTPQPTFQPTQIQDTESGIQLLLDSPTTYIRRVRLNIIGVGSAYLGQAESGYSASNNNQRIAGPFVMWIDTNTNKVLVFNTFDANFTYSTTSEPIAASSSNPNPYGVIDSNGFPVSAGPANYAYEPTGDYFTTTNISPYFYEVPNITEISDDPYSPGGESEPGGGDGDFDFTSTDIPLPGLPNIGAMSTGFLNMYNPSAAQLRSLASYMWSGAFDPQNFKKLFADPMDAILGLHIIPTITGHPATTSSSLYVGNIDTELSMPAVTEQYYSLDCGTVNIPAKWGAYLDYSPYSKLSLYLPYIGIVPLSADDCMRGSIRVQYNIDILSGTCNVSVYCVSNRGRDGHTLYTFTGSCSCECPITEGQYANVIMAGLNVVSGIISGASGGVPGMVAGGVAQAANAAISMVKPEIGRSGSMGGSAGLMGIQYPFLILTVPRMAIPGQQSTYIGYPSFVTKEMSECTGYTEINVTHLNNMTCTDGEADEIIRLLEKGVIF